jgi:hypothetical protein
MECDPQEIGLQGLLLDRLTSRERKTIEAFKKRILPEREAKQTATASLAEGFARSRFSASRRGPRDQADLHAELEYLASVAE